MSHRVVQTEHDVFSVYIKSIIEELLAIACLWKELGFRMEVCD